MSAHAEGKPFGCGQRGVRFTRQGSLLRHAVLHTGEKPFSCDICDKNFYRRAHLKRHAPACRNVHAIVCDKT